MEIRAHISWVVGFIKEYFSPILPENIMPSRFVKRCNNRHLYNKTLADKVLVNFKCLDL